MSKKVAYITPGYPNSGERDNYQKVAEFFQGNDFEVEFIDPDWSTDMKENLSQVSEKLDNISQKYGDHEMYLFGHSLGALCIFAASTDYKPEAQIMASMTPEFQEDNQNKSKIHKTGKYIVRNLNLAKEILDFNQNHLKLSEIRENSGKVFFLYTEKEYYGMFGIQSLGFGRGVTENRKRIFPDAEEIVVDNAKHYMTSEEYLGTVEEVIQKL